MNFDILTSWILLPVLCLKINFLLYEWRCSSKHSEQFFYPDKHLFLSRPIIYDTKFFWYFLFVKRNAIKRNARVHWRITRLSVVAQCMKKRAIVARQNITVIIWKRDPLPNVTSMVKNTRSETDSKMRMQILVILVVRVF